MLEVRGESGDMRAGNSPCPCLELLPSVCGDTSCVSIVKSGVPGLFFETALSLAYVVLSVVGLSLAKLDLCPKSWRSISVEKRTRGAASEERRDIEGRAEFSIAEVRETSAASGLIFIFERWGLSTVYGEVALSAALRVAGDSSSSSWDAECRLRMPPPAESELRASPEGPPAPDIVVEHSLGVVGG